MNLTAARARRRSIALALAAFAAGALACSMPAFASADAPTAQASYYGLDWVPYIDPADLPPLSARPAVCIVDTGAAITPDLPATDTNGSFINRWALDGGAGTPFSANSADIHGTLMATYAFGLDNGWGITGVFPQGRVLEVRAQTTSGGGILYPQGARACREYASTHSLSLAAVSMSLGSPSSPSLAEQSAMQDEIAYAHTLGYSIVVAAGNNPGPVQYPGAFPGVFTAAAGVVGGSLCSYAATGNEVEIVGPSCGITDLDPLSGSVFNGASDRGGSSMATASTSAVMALLRTFKPTASYSEVEAWIVAGSTAHSGQRLLNGAGAMAAAGLGSVVARAQARLQEAQQIDDPPNGNQKDASKTLRTPRARVSFSRGSVRVKALNRPAKAKLVVKLIYRKSEFATSSLKRSASKSTLKIRSKKRPWRVEVRYSKGSSVSPTIRFRDRRTTTFVQLNGSSNK